MIAPNSSPSSSPIAGGAAGLWLSTRPDPIPAILARHRTGRLMLVIVAILALTATVTSLDYMQLPAGWAALVLGWMLVLTALGNIYIKSLGRPPYVDSLLDLTLQKFGQTVKWSILAAVVWVAWDLFARQTPLRAELGILVSRLVNFDVILLGAAPNPIQLAWLLPWLTPLRETLRQAAEARHFEIELAPGMERRISRNIRRARALSAKTNPDQIQTRAAGLLLTEASELLASLAGYAGDGGIIYHRKLLRRKLNLMLGLPVEEEASPDPFYRSSGPPGYANNGNGDDHKHSERTGGKIADLDALFSAGGPAPERPDAAAANGNGAGARQGYEQYREFLESLRERSTVTWASVAGLDEVVSEMKTMLTLSLARAPEGVKLESPRRILLYGPPGTGKTLLSAAISASFDAPFYNVKVSDVLSKFFGESTRLLAALFELAASQGPAVLFFDEIESISGSREGGGMDGEERRMISALLAQLDGLKSKGQASRLFTIAATNLPWQLDAAILSRFEKQFHVPLPDGAARRRILELHLAERGFTVAAPMEKLVDLTRGYSGRELSRLCQEAIRLMLAEANPCMDALADHGQAAMSQYKLKVAPVAPVHLAAAFKKVRPQTPRAQLERYREWQQRTG